LFFISIAFMKIAIGSDHRGVSLRRIVAEIVRQAGHEIIDLGTFSDGPCDYPDVAGVVARMVARKEVDRGILICGTGLGMAIAANKFPGVRAAPCHDDLTAELSRLHNDANVLCLSGDMLGPRLVERIVHTWLRTEFEGGRHLRRLNKIRELECRNGKLSDCFQPRATQ
jgi:ribose 5-phosphate isomerase B